MEPVLPDPLHGLVGESPQIREIRRLIEKVAATRAPVLLLGESGTGKEVVARAIYQARPAGQFVPIDCGTLVGPLMESELFGHTRGAFTGALEAKRGLIELAEGGTAFLDEIGDLPLDMQVKLLRLLQEHEFRPVGSLSMRRVDVRVIAATRRNLPEEVAAGRFRDDLYYRLNVIKIQLPPLRERREDIPLLADFFLARVKQAHGVFRSYEFSPETRELMRRYDWPGNARELRNCIEQMLALHSGPVLRVEDLPTLLRYCEASTRPERVLEAGAAADAPLLVRPAPQRVLPLREMEKQAILRALEQTGGDRLKAARLLQIGRTTLYRKLKEYRIPS